MTDNDSDTPADDREVYYAEARSWALDSQASSERSRRIAWIVAAIAMTVALLEALALVALAPIKTVVPYTVMVDRTTGYVQTLSGNQPQQVKPQAALSQSMLAQYVIARETFDINSLADQYRKVALWSGEEARRDYLALMPISNPQSPINIFPRASLVTTTVSSVSMTGADTAQVRFITERRDQPQGAGVRSYWVGVLRFRYAGEPMSVEDRLVNPLGFQVVSYRRDQEAVPQTVAPPLAQPAAPVQSVLPAQPGNAAPVQRRGTM